MALKPAVTPSDALHEVFERVVKRVRRGEIPPVAEREFVDATIQLANLASDDPDEAMQLYWTFTLRPYGHSRWDQRNDIERVNTQEIRAFRGDAQILGVLKTAQPRVRKVLLDLVEKPRTARLCHASKITDWISKLELCVIPKFERNTLRYENVAYASTSVGPAGAPDPLTDLILPIAGWALAVLLDQNRRVGQYLHQCRLEECGNLFLALPTKDGGKPIRYCSDEHIAEARRQQAARRSQRYRERIASRHK
jgi:hypothetical protein